MFSLNYKGNKLTQLIIKVSLPKSDTVSTLATFVMMARH